MMKPRWLVVFVTEASILHIGWSEDEKNANTHTHTCIGAEREDKLVNVCVREHNNQIDYRKQCVWVGKNKSSVRQRQHFSERKKNKTKKEKKKNHIIQEI